MALKNLTNLWLSPNRTIRVSRAPAGYSTCTVEFDDQGELWDPRHSNPLLPTLGGVTAGAEEGTPSSSKTEVIVITFIHVGCTMRLPRTRTSSTSRSDSQESRSGTRFRRRDWRDAAIDYR